MKTLRQYQVEGRDFLLQGNRLLAFAPGLGKTATTIEACKQRLAMTTAVVCPAVALSVWRDEVLDQWPECTPIYLRDMIHAGVPLPPEPRMLITSPDLLVANKDARALLASLGRFDVLIMDESTFAKEPKAKRTMLMYGPLCAGGGLASMADVTWLLSGTPILNHVGEIFGAVRCLAPDLIEQKSYDAFTRKFCTRAVRTVRTKTGRTINIEVIDGSNRAELPDLARRLRPFWLRKRTEDVLADLPPLRIAVRHLDASACDPTALDQLEHSEEAEVLRMAIASGDPEALRNVEGQISRLRRLMAMTKVGAASAWVEDVFDQGVRKVILFGWHVAALERLSELLVPHGVALLTGATLGKKREKLILAFQTDPTCRVFIGQIQAAGTAITLTAADRVVMLEQSFVPAQNFQAIKRAHRIGQRSSVLAEILVAPGLDEIVGGILARKLSDIEAIENGEAA